MGLATLVTLSGVAPEQGDTDEIQTNRQVDLGSVQQAARDPGAEVVPALRGLLHPAGPQAHAQAGAVSLPVPASSHDREQAAVWAAYGTFQPISSAPTRSGDVRVLRGISGETGAQAEVDLCAPGFSWPCAEAEAIVYGPTPSCPTGESSGDWSAVNGTSYGGFQINWPYHLDKLERVTGSRDPELLFVPAVNIAVAYDIWNADGGFSAWSCAQGR